MEAAATEDRFLGGRVLAAQPAGRAHRAGLDAVLLQAAVPDGATGVLVDLGAGVGVAGLAAAVRCPGLSVVLVERDAATAALARRSVALNAAAAGGRARVVEADVTAPAALLEAAGLPAGMADHVVMNPPFHPADRSRGSPDAARAAAHLAGPGDLDRWVRAAARLCRPSGRLAVIWRADDLPALLAAVSARFGGLVLKPVQPRAEAPASRVVLLARPQSRAPFRLLPPLVLHEGDGDWTGAADAVLRGAALAMG